MPVTTNHQRTVRHPPAQDNRYGACEQTSFVTESPVDEVTFTAIVDTTRRALDYDAAALYTRLLNEARCFTMNWMS